MDTENSRGSKAHRNGPDLPVLGNRNGVSLQREACWHRQGSEGLQSPESQSWLPCRTADAHKALQEDVSRIPCSADDSGGHPSSICSCNYSALRKLKWSSLVFTICIESEPSVTSSRQTPVTFSPSPLERSLEPAHKVLFYKYWGWVHNTFCFSLSSPPPGTVMLSQIYP